MSQNSHHLKAPKLPELNTLEFKTCARPSRSLGIRLEIEHHHGKLLIHNYGHGGSGLSLAHGSAQVALELLEKKVGLPPSSSLFPSSVSQSDRSLPSIAVLGAGVIGLTTADHLLRKGFPVHIYAESFPPFTTSNTGTGIFWTPFKADAFTHLSPSQQELFVNLRERSWKALNPKLNGGMIIPGVRFAPLYHFGAHINELPIDPLLRHETVDVHFDSGKKRTGLYFQNLLIDSPMYINSLFEKVKCYPVIISEQQLSASSLYSSVKESILINCTGLGSRLLFDDPHIKSHLGHLIYLPPQDEIQYIVIDHTSRTLGSTQITLNLIPWHDRIILGSSSEEMPACGLPDMKVIQALYSNVQDFFG